MLEDILGFIATLAPIWIYVLLTFFAYIENVFPPSPSDMVVVVGGSIVATGTISFIPTLLLTTAGSVLGFMTLYSIGRLADKKIIKERKIKYISYEALEKAENWFKRYGYWIIFANRFLPGTRSVVSLFAGISKLDLKKTVLLSTASALLWNALIIYLGMIFGYNIAYVDKLLSTYNNVIIIITIVVVLFFTARYFYVKFKNRKNK